MDKEKNPRIAPRARRGDNRVRSKEKIATSSRGKYETAQDPQAFSKDI